MKILAFSDLHLSTRAADAILAVADQADLILGAGDFANQHSGLHDFMTRLEPIADKAIHIPGNNETEAALRSATTATVLHGEAITRAGVRIVGLGCAVPPLPPELSWDSFNLTEQQAEAMLAPFDACDVLLCHSPPFGIADRHPQLGSLGSKAVYDAALRMQPKLLLCGHIHDAWGEEGQIGQTRVVNLGPGPNWFTL